MAAERLGFDRATALTLGQAVAGHSAYVKGVSLGIIEPKPELVRQRGDELAEGESLHVDLLGRAVPVVRTPEGLRAVSKGKPGKPAQIEKYLAGKFGDQLEAARAAMAELAASQAPADLYRRGSGSTRRSGLRCPPVRVAGVPRGSSTWPRSVS